MVKGENERLLQRIHELLIGAELREEARESNIITYNIVKSSWNTAIAMPSNQ